MTQEKTNERGLTRRGFLAAGLGAGVFTSGWLARGATATPERQRKAQEGEGGYGPLSPAPSENTGEVLLALPAGFRYTVFGRTRSPMNDGRPTPPAHDGMATFEGPDGAVRLIRNHEVRGQAPAPGQPAYDPRSGGGTTTLDVDPETRLPVRSFLSLSGTNTNCAGGPTPWGSWVTCEETTSGTAQGYGRNHGYNFEVPASADGVVEPVPLEAMGRFVHEAVAVDPRTGIVYQTEDTGSSGVYRFVPDRARDLTAGKLQMLAIRDRPNYDTRTGQRERQPLPVTWVDVPDPRGSVFQQGFSRGGAVFDRVEGAWYGDGSVFINSTSGGDANLGQVWQYRPRGNSGGILTLLYEPTDPVDMQSPDNITVSPGGGIAVCEDGAGEQYVRGLTQRGLVFDFALNTANGSEFAGATFSPDGETFFVNVQSPGYTLAIWGPFEKGAF